MTNLTDVNVLKNLLSGLRLKPKDYLGQNFLVSEEVLQEILDIAEIKKSDTVVEVGPGMGVLTGELVKVAGTVIAIEKDARLASFLESQFLKKNVAAGFSLPQTESGGLKSAATSDGGTLKIINQDILKFNFETLPSKYKVVANIPYYLTSHLIQILITSKNKPEKIVLMVQKEVGERIVAGPGDLSLLGISVQVFADAFIAAIVPAENFWPKPQVDSCVIVIEPKNKYPQIKDQKKFFSILKIAFAGKRKQVHNTLQNGLEGSKGEKEAVEKILAEANINPKSRPQDLTIAQWIQLYKIINTE